MMRQAWVNGALVGAAEPHIRLDDHGFTVGDGVFETLLSIDGQPFALTRHVDRLQNSARGLGLAPPSGDDVRAGVRAVLLANGDELGAGTGRVRVTYTSGPGPAGSDRGNDRATLVVTAEPSPPWPATTTVGVSRWPRNERSPLRGLKTTSYAENAVALAETKAEGHSEALLANLAGDLCEGTGSNVFVVKGDELITPPLDSGCLAGITRALVLKWCVAREAAIPMADLSQADEIFITSSTRNIHPVTRVDARHMPSDRPVTTRCQEIFARRVAENPDP